MLMAVSSRLIRYRDVAHRGIGQILFIDNRQGNNKDVARRAGGICVFHCGIRGRGKRLSIAEAPQERL